MSENKIPNEQELWDVLDGKAAPEVKPEPKPIKTEPKFAKPDAPKGKIDSFFLTCMAGVEKSVDLPLGGIGQDRQLFPDLHGRCGRCGGCRNTAGHQPGGRRCPQGSRGEGSPGPCVR